jgi:hypothetical protein
MSKQLGVGEFFGCVIGGCARRQQGSLGQSVTIVLGNQRAKKKAQKEREEPKGQGSSLEKTFQGEGTPNRQEANLTTLPALEPLKSHDQKRKAPGRITRSH